MLRKIDLMHELFGEIPDRKCKDCQHICSYTANRKWYKCAVYGESSSEATDWRLKWTACGMIDVPLLTNYPIVKQVRFLNRKPKDDDQIEGQLVLDEFIGISVPKDAWTKVKKEGCLHISTKFKAGEHI